jgi:hypothetical protein
MRGICCCGTCPLSTARSGYHCPAALRLIARCPSWAFSRRREGYCGTHRRHASDGYPAQPCCGTRQLTQSMARSGYLSPACVLAADPTEHQVPLVRSMRACFPSVRVVSRCPAVWWLDQGQHSENSTDERKQCTPVLVAQQQQRHAVLRRRRLQRATLEVLQTGRPGTDSGGPPESLQQVGAGSVRCSDAS